MTTVQVIGPYDPAWSEVLARAPHDVHHLPGWSVASAPLEQGEPFAVHVTDDRGAMLVPFVRRALPVGRWDAVSPYGYGGPIIADGSADQWALLSSAAAHLRSEGCVSWFLRLHPLLDTWVDAVPRSQPGLVEHGEAVSIDLSLDDAGFLAGLRRDHRADIRRAERDGVRVRRGDDGRDLDTFVELHRSTMELRAASDYHRFSAGYFDALADALGEDLVLLLAELDHRVVAGAIFVVSAVSGIVGYHLAASVPGPPRGSTKLLVAEGRRVGRERGCEHLLLGGGLGFADDALFSFKAGFSPTRHRARTLRLVLDEEEYRRRCAVAGAQSTDLTGYFPAYRTS
jgi:hypothetical protein